MSGHSVGSSVIDYFTTSLDFPYTKLNQICVHSRVESQHMPVSLTLNTVTVQTARAAARQPHSVTKLEWQDGLAHEYQHTVSSDYFKSVIDEATRMIDSDPETALDKFVASLLEAAEPMKKTMVFGNRRRQGAPWFDQECRDSKQNVERILRKWKKTKGGKDRVEFITERNKHGCLVREKRREYEALNAQKLKDSVKDQRSFWKTVKGVNKGASTGNNITPEEWVEHFKSVFCTDSFCDESCENDSGDDEWEGYGNDDSEQVNASVHDEELNRDIQADEVKAAIDHLRNGKSPGPDNVIGELLKRAQSVGIPFLVKFFNYLFSQGQFPKQWTKALLVPIHKKGDVNNPDNYRGISLLSILSKCYTYILTKRLEWWAETQGKIIEEQGGFRKGRSTIDSIFVMIFMIEKSLSKSKGKLYVAFVDFRKAYDSVNRNLLWDVLRRAGGHGKMLKALKAMYKSVTASVRAQTGLITEEFACPVGLKQGECSSPILFSFFINELAMTLIEKGSQGIQFVANTAEVFLLLFADDVALVSSSPQGLQNQIRNLKSEADRLKLEVNLEKTKVMVFRKGGSLTKRERWWYGENQVEVVNAYKYLGLTLSTKLSSSQAIADFIPKAKRKIVTILKALSKLKCCDWNVFVKIFEAQIQPSLLYASEIWGACRLEAIERVHMFGLKCFLKVSMRTPSVIVHGECGRYPLFIRTQSNCVRYWLRLLCMERERLPYLAYQCSYSLAERGKKSWAEKVKNLLLQNGFGEAWYNQGVGNPKRFLGCFTQRLQDCYEQNWHEKVEKGDRFAEYRLFKQYFQIEDYLTSLEAYMRGALFRFRAGISWLKIHRSRFTAEVDLSCPYCSNKNEDELHFYLNVTGTAQSDRRFCGVKTIGSMTCSGILCQPVMRGYRITLRCSL